MLDDIKKRPGRIVEHQDGRVGIAYNNDQMEQFIVKDKIIVRFFESDNFKNLSKEKRAVKSELLTIKGYTD